MLHFRVGRRRCDHREQVIDAILSLYPSMKMAVVNNKAVRLLPVLVLVATAVILLLHYQQVARLKEKVFESRVLETQQQARTQLKRLFDPVIINLSIMGRWVGAESPDLSEVAALNSRFVPVLEEVTQIASALVADTTGREYMLMRAREGWLTRLTDVQRWNDRSHWSRWTRPGQAVEDWQENLDYDPRKRPWFRGAIDSVAQDAVFWTTPYKFFTSKALGITAATRWPLPAREGQFIVVAFDVLLTELSALTMGLMSGEDGRAFILTGDGRVVGVPDDPQFQTPATIAASVLTAATEFPVAVVRDAYDAWLARDRAGNDPFVFSSNGATWWASFWNYTLGNQSLWLAVAVPESGLVSRLGEPDSMIPATIIGIGVITFLVTFVTLRKFQAGLSDRVRPDEGLNRILNKPGADPSQQVQALIREGENESLELKSSVRWNFKAGRTGKEMELAWLKTVVAYLNTEGGVILLGVDDAGKVLGLDNDGFANDDKALRHVENLIARHIGPAYFPYIRSRMISVEGKKVLTIDCGTSPKPVFLKHDKGEDFYIRTGPASRSLAPSEILAYIETRKLQ
jgi:hypothetical protein